MKTPHFLTGLLVLASVVGLRAADPSNPPRTEVIFSDPDRFTDAADGPRGTAIRRDSNLAEIRDHLIRRAEKYVAEGQHLSVTITDVDLAGEHEPWRTGSHDTRIVKDIYQPRIDLEFRLTDASGAVVKEGKRHLSDLAFMTNLNSNPNDSRVYEKRLLDDWLRREFKSARK